MTAEIKIKNQIRKALSPKATLFTNPVGVAWAGKFVGKKGNITFLSQARQISFGLIQASSDLIGWQSIFITPDMVGEKIARFIAIETKSETGKPTADQLHFLTMVKIAGGAAGVARSVEDAVKILEAK